MKAIKHTIHSSSRTLLDGPSWTLVAYLMHKGFSDPKKMVNALFFELNQWHPLKDKS